MYLRIQFTLFSVIDTQCSPWVLLLFLHALSPMSVFFYLLMTCTSAALQKIGHSLLESTYSQKYMISLLESASSQKYMIIQVFWQSLLANHCLMPECAGSAPLGGRNKLWGAIYTLKPPFMIRLRLEFHLKPPLSWLLSCSAASIFLPIWFTELS